MPKQQRPNVKPAKWYAYTNYERKYGYFAPFIKHKKPKKKSYA